MKSMQKKLSLYKKKKMIFCFFFCNNKNLLKKVSLETRNTNNAKDNSSQYYQAS